MKQAGRGFRAGLAAAILALGLSVPVAAQAAGQTASPAAPAAPAAPARPAAPAGGAVSAAALPQGPYRFAFTYAKGDLYRVLSTVDEDVYVNRRFQNHSEISNRIAVEVTDAAPDGSWGLLKATFDTDEKLAGATVALVQESYDSEYRRDSLGRCTIDPRYYMPVVRNVPVFPDRALSPGDTWTAPGEERHDLRQVFGIPDPYAIPFECRYRYEGPVVKDGKAYLLVSASYTIFYQPAPPRAYASIYPVQIAGFSDQKIYWDPGLGQPGAYEERFKLVFDWSDGTNIEYRGTAQAGIVEAKRMDRAAVQADLRDAVADLPNVAVTADDRGVTISLEDIQFLAESATLRPEELAKIRAIAEVLGRYPDRDILVSGHTALAGSAEGRLKLSQERAMAVAKALVATGLVDASRIRTIGWGAEKPVADNATPQGMARNRRVEITILEN